MSWVSIDDGAPDHRKFLRLAEEEKDNGAAAVTLWWAALCYANRQKARDGFIPSAKITALWPFPAKVALAAAAALVRVELWAVVSGGYKIHDYTEYQLSAEKLAARIEARREAGRLGGQRSGEARRAKQSEAETKQVLHENEALAFEANEASANPLPTSSSPVGSANQQPPKPPRSPGRVLAHPNDPITLALVESAVFAEENPRAVAGGMRVIARAAKGRTEDEILEAVGLSLAALGRGLTGENGVGAGKFGSYASSVLEKLLAPNGLEAARAGRMPRVASDGGDMWESLNREAANG